MRMRRPLGAASGPLFWLSLLLALSHVGVARAAAPIGSDFQVNTYVTSDQGHASVAMDADGDFVVVWESNAQDGSTLRRVRPPLLERRRGPRRRVPGQHLHRRHAGDPPVAVDADGDFVVAWQSISAGRVELRHLRAALLERAARRSAASSRSTPTRTASRSACLGGGRRRRRLRRRLAELRPGRRRRLGRLRPAVLELGRSASAASSRSTPTPRTSRRYAVGGDWTPTATSSSPGRARVRTCARLRRLRAPVLERRRAAGGEFQVNTYTPGSQGYPAVAMDADGDFVDRLGEHPAGRRAIRCSSPRASRAPATPSRASSRSTCRPSGLSNSPRRR